MSTLPRVSLPPGSVMELMTVGTTRMRRCVPAYLTRILSVLMELLPVPMESVSTRVGFVIGEI